MLKKPVAGVLFGAGEDEVGHLIDKKNHANDSRALALDVGLKKQLGEETQIAFQRSSTLRTGPPLKIGVLLAISVLPVLILAMKSCLLSGSS